MLASVTGLVLVNADTGQDIGPLTSGATLNLATLPTRHLIVRADASSDAQSVKFRLDSQTAIDNTSPYTQAWTPSTGSHTFSATAYIRDNAKGSNSTRSISFTMIDDDGTPPDVPPPSLPGVWKLDYADEFDDDSADGWRTNIWWNPSGATPGNIGIETTSPSAVTVSGGTLNLTATQTGPSSYTSGLVTTDGSYSFTYGYVEARIQIPAGQGIWPAFWMLPSSHSDGRGELDIMEVVGDEPWMLHMNYHVKGRGSGARSTDVGVDLSADFHTYGVDWQKDKIVWYLDGKEMFRIANRTNEPMYLILNLAVGGDWPGMPDATTTFPSTMKVDYVHVWKKTG